MTPTVPPDAKEVRITEKTIQSSLISWAMNSAQHKLALPNPTSILTWEADVITVNRANLITEFEIKISKADYRKEKKKTEKLGDLSKHYTLHQMNKKHTAPLYGRLSLPNYFYYVTYDFDIDPPAWAGWIKINKMDTYWLADLLHGTIKKNAPRLHVGKITEEQIKHAAYLLSFRLSNAYKIAHPYYIEKKGL